MIERRKLEEEREVLLAREREARAQAELASRTKDEFLAIVSHELRTPLAAVLASVRAVAAGYLGSDEQRVALERIERNTRVQARLVDDLMDLSRIVAGNLTVERRPVGVAAVVEDAVAALRPDAERKQITVSVHIPERAGRVLGDAERLQQIMLNLVGNAVKFTPTNGSITVTVSARDNRVLIQVRDTGAGIAPELLPHIFDRFVQGAVGRRAGGLGLGLAIVHYLADVHGGSVRADSEGVGKGATFTVELPRLTDEAASPSAA